VLERTVQKFANFYVETFLIALEAADMDTLKIYNSLIVEFVDNNDYIIFWILFAMAVASEIYIIIHVFFVIYLASY
jgi:hypothetical protein